MTPPVPDARGAVASSLGKWKGRAMLWTDTDYRRDAIRLLFMGLRGLMRAKFGMAFGLVAVAGGYLSYRGVASPREAHEFLTQLFGVAAILLAAPIYASEQRQGTFELLWLARGSQGALLRFKVAVLMTGMLLLMVPAVLVTSWFLGGELPIIQSLVFLLTNSLFVVAVMALVCTYLPQMWAGGFLGATIVVSIYLLGRGHAGAFTIFLNPVDQTTGLEAGGGAFQVALDAGKVAVTNRMASLVFSGLLLVAASRRLKRAFTG